jgi:hypothetical protein
MEFHISEMLCKRGDIIRPPQLTFGIHQNNLNRRDGDLMALNELLNQIDLDMYFNSLPAEVQNKIAQHADKINSANDLFIYGERYSQEITNYHFT